jgi:hypothetical protein
MREMFNEIDDWLEDKYGSMFSLHPNRPARGKTYSREMDGLFNIGAAFTAGYGSKYGRGYIVDVRISTLDHVPQEVREEIYSSVASLVKEKLKVFFPERELEIVREGNLLKIIGDFSLGSVSY